jgi:hypothetical protein
MPMHEPKSNPFPGLFMLAGFCLLAGGGWWIYKPAGLIVAGLMLIGWAFFGRSF